MFISTTQVLFYEANKPNANNEQNKEKQFKEILDGHLDGLYLRNHDFSGERKNWPEP